MKVIVLSMWYPNAENPVCGTFVHEQVSALREHDVQIKVIQPIPLTPFPVNMVKASYKKLFEIPYKEVYKSVEVYHPRYLALPRHLLYENVGKWMYKGILKTVMRIYREWPFDIVHAHATYPCGYSANLIRDNHLKDVKVIHTIHRTCIVDAPNYNRKCLARVNESLSLADWDIFVSMEGYQLAMAYTGGEIKEKSSYITNGVNTWQFSFTEKEENEVNELKARYNDSINILFVGYLTERKGIKELLHAYKTLNELDAKVKTRLFLVGRNLLGSYVEKFIMENGLKDKVITTGPVLHDHIKKWFKFADIFILPSHSEGLATVLFEALYMGKPAVFTKVGGTCDIVKDMEHALLINPKKENEIVSALSRLINDPDLRERLGRNGRALIGENYTWQINAGKNVEIYKKICGIT